MDIINPELIWIDGMCYRINNSHDVPIHQEDSVPHLQEYIEDDEDMDEDLILTSCGNGRTRTSLPIPQSFFGYIIGAKGVTRKRIENETRCDIKIPSRGQNGDITITGNDAKGVATAARRIKMIVSASRTKQIPTHFLSLPINSDVIKRNFNNFKELVLNDNNRGVDELVFNNPDKLHLTLFMMHLADNRERELAKTFLDKATTKVINPMLNGITLDVRVKGLAYMNDDPQQVHVLYADVTEVDNANSGILTKLTEELRSFFSKSGLLIRNFDAVKLHLTLMNSRNRIDDDNSNVKRVPFDASTILKKYQDFEFGEMKLNSVHLSQRQAVGPDGYYLATSVVSI